MAARRVLLAVALCLAQQSDGFYLPGVAPRAFKDGEAVQMKVQTLVSTETPLQFDYYQLPFCEPRKIHDLPENLGEALAGEKAHTSAFKARVKVNEYCKVLCRKNYTPQQMEEFQDFAILEYRVNMRLDNLPVAEMINFAFEDKPDKTMQIYNLGYALGGKLAPEEKKAGSSESDTYVLNNHLRFKIKYHPVDTDGVMTEGSPDGNYIVGFEVMPFSIKHSYYGKWNASAIPYHKLTTCSGDPPNGRFERHQPQVIDPTEGGQVIFTYDVEWEMSTVKWASRWDVYLQMTDDKIHWFSIINSVVIVVFLTGIVGLIMTRILRKDFARYNEEGLSAEEKAENAREMREETGWKLVYADVFRPPPFATLLSVYAGTGAQLLIMSFLTLVFAALGFLSPANRGSLLSASLFFFVLMGVPAGYVSARFCKLVKEPNHFKATLLTALLFPGVCFAIFFLINLVAWSRQSSTAVPFGTLIVLMLLWFGVSLPLIFFGAFLGFKRETISLPVQTASIPRQIPPQAWYMHPAVSAISGGLLTFGAVFVEMFFILSSIWQHRFYYVFGFLAIVFAILLVTCVEIAIVMCYLHLCAEDYRWWWRSMITGGATSVYMFFYAAFHYFSRAHPSAKFDLLASSIYFGYMLIMSYGIFVLCGFTGFLSCFLFIRKIYASIKID
eukprot:Tamp_06629.p1 GENE.Tamp_06629~~Tamp_06629.p1  ORF type:complete len:677 (+),score=209.81 Tamp_06629:26-2032(+)